MSWQTPRAEKLQAIGEVSEITGLSPRTVRYYEELGLLPNVRRRAGGRRVYGADEIERLLFIQRLKALGLSLADVKELNLVYAIGGSTRAMLERLDVVLGRHTEEVGGRIAELTSLRDEIQSYRDHVAIRLNRLSGLAGSRRRRGDGPRRGTG